MSNEKKNSNNKAEKPITVKFGRQVPTPSNSLKPKIVVKPNDKKQILGLINLGLERGKNKNAKGL